MKSQGTQHIAEFINCDFSKLDSPEVLEEILRTAIKDSGLNQVKIISHKFSPVGVTVLAIISESHVGIHTYPESNHISLDVFTCSSSIKQLKLINLLREEFLPETVKLVEIQRGNPIEVTDKNRITSASSYGFEIKYVVDEILYQGKSNYQEIEIIQNPLFGKMMFLDKDLQLAETDCNQYNDALFSNVKQDVRGKDILILGGGDGTLLNKILEREPHSVTLVDIDPEVVKLSDKYFFRENNNSLRDSSVNIVNEDVFNYFDNSPKFDIIFYDLTMNPEAFTRKPRNEYISALFEKIYSALKNGAEFSMQCGSVHDTASLLLSDRLLKEYFGSYTRIDQFIPSFCESRVFSSTQKK
ncbi:MAG: hypothetical protein SCALA702_13120 [Melioribacteraceae bacterium]|nr:MAG: hypothetical protein SCALA702_13120 [Melioribacteraceae bacterium]